MLSLLNLSLVVFRSVMVVWLMALAPSLFLSVVLICGILDLTSPSCLLLILTLAILVNVTMNCLFILPSHSVISCRLFSCWIPQTGWSDFYSLILLPMGNLSYCRFQNTATDLADCMDHFDETVIPSRDDDIDEDTEYLSVEEGRARDRIIRMAKKIAHEHPGDYSD